MNRIVFGIDLFICGKSEYSTANSVVISSICTEHKGQNFLHPLIESALLFPLSEVSSKIEKSKPKLILKNLKLEYN